ncbi:MAG: DUF5519 family protein [Alphaproteobacteria bacterium]|nr:DUF5519 family protein [Alphaproteobacteria bacterium]
MGIRIVHCFMILLLAATSSAWAQNRSLPARETPIPRTTNGVPHVQIGVDPVPEISAELLKRVSAVSGIEIQDTIVSLPGALGFWITNDVALARPEAIVRGREFAHIHPDGSLHAALPPALADQAVELGWAIHHPWSDQRAGWEGFVMIYTPVSRDELDVVLDLIMASYEFVTGTAAKTK